MDPTSRPIDATCEHCGTVTQFPWEKRGQVEDCPACCRWMDVPDPLEDLVVVEPEVELLEAPREPLPERPDLGLRFTFERSLPWPDWKGVIERHPFDGDPTRLHEVYWEAALCWLDTLAGYLPSHHVVTTENFAILSPVQGGELSTLQHAVERYRESILYGLQGAVSDAGFGPHVLLVFDGFKIYDHYIAAFRSEEETAESGGILIDAEYSHVAFPWQDEWRIVLAHELTHLLLRHLPLPLWVNEGIAQLATQSHQISGSAEVREVLKAQLTFWREHGLQDFWTGTAFVRQGDWQPFSYELAELLVHNLRYRNRCHLFQFFNQVTWDDAGDQALRDSFGCSLSDIVTEVLGPGDWQPKFPLWPVQEPGGGIPSSGQSPCSTLVDM